GWTGGVDTARPHADSASRPLCVRCRVRPVHRGSCMSVDPAGDVARRIERLIDAALAFNNCDYWLAEDPSSGLQLDLGRAVIDLGRAVRELADSLRSLEDDELPLDDLDRSGMRWLWRLLRDFVGRRGWEHILRPDGEEFLLEQERLRNDRWRSYLGDVL